MIVGPILTASQAEKLTELEAGRPSREVRSRHDARPLRRHHPHGGGGIGLQQALGHDQGQGGVAEQREPFVVGQRQMLVGVRGMRQSAGEELTILELVLQPTFELGDAGGIHLIVGGGDFTVRH